MATHQIETTAQKSVRGVWREHREEREQMNRRHEREMAAAVAAEFPVGCKVKWKHGHNMISGLVFEHMRYSWHSEKVIVQNTKSGAKKEIEAWELEHAD
ncbi:MAG TPA: hypothetical protein VEC57_00210 [Candidatus Limnocylindrales bacterium]|nr:hypothetical protein [Candidatus Limnocylindrales bacterium]